MDVNLLNRDCLEEIFRYSTIVERIQLERVCRKWREASLGSWRHVKSINLSDAKWQFLFKFKSNKLKRIIRTILLKCGTFVKRFKDPQSEDFWQSSVIFEAVTNHCPNLETVHALNTQITATAVAYLAQNCQRIKELRLGRSIQNSEHQLVKLLNSNPNLIHVHLERHMIQGRCFLHISQPIETLILDKCVKVGAYPPSSWKCGLNQLETLIINCSPVLSLQDCIEFLNRFDRNNALRTLGIPNYNDSSKDFIPIDKFHNLQKLSIKRNNGVDDKFIDSLVTTCAGLIYLDISGCEMVTDAGLLELKCLTRLEVLNVSCSDFIRGDGFHLLDGLTHLNCCFCASITEENMIKVLENCSKLTCLKMEGCGNITNRFFLACIEAVRNRMDNLTLDLNIDCTSMEIDETFLIPSLLRFINCEPIP